MGKSYKFRFSDMMPNAWFYKLKDMNNNKPRNLLPKTPKRSIITSSNDHLSKITNQPHMSDQRKSYHFTRDLDFHPNSPTKATLSDHNNISPPRKSSSKRRRSIKKTRPLNRKSPRHVSTSISADCSCRAKLESVWTKPEDPPLDNTSSSEHDSVIREYGSDQTLSTTSDGTTFDETMMNVSSTTTTTCQCTMQNDIVLEINDNEKLDHLPPIITKKQEKTKSQRTSTEFSKTNAYESLSVKVVKEDFVKTSTTKSPVGVRLRTNSPRIANKKIQGGRKSTSSSSSSLSKRSVSGESFAVVKTSRDPWRDFRESMVEMIVENNIKGSKDLEDLLACYLSLNSDEYHEIIINVFKQIWFDYVRVRLIK